MIRIASGQAFWGDWPQAPLLQVRSGPTYAQAPFRMPLEVTSELAEEVRALWGERLPADCILDEAPDAVDEVPDAVDDAPGVIDDAPEVEGRR